MSEIISDVDTKLKYADGTKVPELMKRMSNRELDWLYKKFVENDGSAICFAPTPKDWASEWFLTEKTRKNNWLYTTTLRDIPRGTYGGLTQRAVNNRKTYKGKTFGQKNLSERGGYSLIFPLFKLNEDHYNQMIKAGNFGTANEAGPYQYEKIEISGWTIRQSPEENSLDENTLKYKHPAGIGYGKYSWYTGSVGDGSNGWRKDTALNSYDTNTKVKVKKYPFDQPELFVEEEGTMNDNFITFILNSTEYSDRQKVFAIRARHGLHYVSDSYVSLNEGWEAFGGWVGNYSVSNGKRKPGVGGFDSPTSNDIQNLGLDQIIACQKLKADGKWNGWNGTPWTTHIVEYFVTSKHIDRMTNGRGGWLDNPRDYFLDIRNSENNDKNYISPKKAQSRYKVTAKSNAGMDIDGGCMEARVKLGYIPELPINPGDWAFGPSPIKSTENLFDSNGTGRWRGHFLPPWGHVSDNTNFCNDSFLKLIRNEYSRRNPDTPDPDYFLRFWKNPDGTATNADPGGAQWINQNLEKQIHPEAARVKNTLQHFDVTMFEPNEAVFLGDLSMAYVFPSLTSTYMNFSDTNFQKWNSSFIAYQALNHAPADHQFLKNKSLWQNDKINHYANDTRISVFYSPQWLYGPSGNAREKTNAYSSLDWQQFSENTVEFDITQGFGKKINPYYGDFMGNKGFLLAEEFQNRLKDGIGIRNVAGEPGKISSWAGWIERSGGSVTQPLNAYFETHPLRRNTIFRSIPIKMESSLGFDSPEKPVGEWYNVIPAPVFVLGDGGKDYKKALLQLEECLNFYIKNMRNIGRGPETTIGINDTFRLQGPATFTSRDQKVTNVFKVKIDGVDWPVSYQEMVFWIRYKYGISASPRQELWQSSEDFKYPIVRGYLTPIIYNYDQYTNLIHVPIDEKIKKEHPEFMDDNRSWALETTRRAEASKSEQSWTGQILESVGDMAVATETLGLNYVLSAMNDVYNPHSLYYGDLMIPETLLRYNYDDTSERPTNVYSVIQYWDWVVRKATEGTLKTPPVPSQESVKNTDGYAKKLIKMLTPKMSNGILISNLISNGKALAAFYEIENWAKYVYDGLKTGEVLEVPFEAGNWTEDVNTRQGPGAAAAKKIQHMDEGFAGEFSSLGIDTKHYIVCGSDPLNLSEEEKKSVYRYSTIFVSGLDTPNDNPRSKRPWSSGKYSLFPNNTTWDSDRKFRTDGCESVTQYMRHIIRPDLTQLLSTNLNSCYEKIINVSLLAGHLARRSETYKLVNDSDTIYGRNPRDFYVITNFFDLEHGGYKDTLNNVKNVEDHRNRVKSKSDGLKLSSGGNLKYKALNTYGGLSATIFTTVLKEAFLSPTITGLETMMDQLQDLQGLPLFEQALVNAHQSWESFHNFKAYVNWAGYLLKVETLGYKLDGIKSKDDVYGLWSTTMTMGYSTVSALWSIFISDKFKKYIDLAKAAGKEVPGLEKLYNGLKTGLGWKVSLSITLLSLGIDIVLAAFKQQASREEFLSLLAEATSKNLLEAPYAESFGEVKISKSPTGKIPIGIETEIVTDSNGRTKTIPKVDANGNYTPTYELVSTSQRPDKNSTATGNTGLTFRQQQNVKFYTYKHTGGINAGKTDAEILVSNMDDTDICAFLKVAKSKFYDSGQISKLYWENEYKEDIKLYNSQYHKSYSSFTRETITSKNGMGQDSIMYNPIINAAPNSFDIGSMNKTWDSIRTPATVFQDWNNVVEFPYVDRSSNYDTFPGSFFRYGYKHENSQLTYMFKTTFFYPDVIISSAEDLSKYIYCSMPSKQYRVLRKPQIPSVFDEIILNNGTSKNTKHSPDSLITPYSFKSFRPNVSSPDGDSLSLYSSELKYGFDSWGHFHHIKDNILFGSGAPTVSSQLWKYGEFAINSNALTLSNPLINKWALYAIIDSGDDVWKQPIYTNIIGKSYKQITEKEVIWLIRRKYGVEAADRSPDTLSSCCDVFSAEYVGTNTYKKDNENSRPIITQNCQYEIDLANETFIKLLEEEKKRRKNCKCDYEK